MKGRHVIGIEVIARKSITQPLGVKRVRVHRGFLGGSGAKRPGLVGLFQAMEGDILGQVDWPPDGVELPRSLALPADGDEFPAPQGTQGSGLGVEGVMNPLRKAHGDAAIACDLAAPAIGEGATGHCEPRALRTDPHRVAG